MRRKKVKAADAREKQEKWAGRTQMTTRSMQEIQRTVTKECETRESSGVQVKGHYHSTSTVSTSPVKNKG